MHDDARGRQTQKPLLSIYPLSLNPNVRRRQSTMVSKAYNPYRLVWRWNSCIYTSILLLLAIQVKHHCKFAVHLHINIWKIESNPHHCNHSSLNDNYCIPHIGLYYRDEVCTFHMSILPLVNMQSTTYHIYHASKLIFLYLRYNSER